MISSRNGSVANRVSHTILFIAATAGFVAAVAAAPAAPSVTDVKAVARADVVRDDAVTGIRPLGRGPAIRVGRAFDAEDEDCTVTITRVTDESGHVHIKRGLTCAN